MFQPKMFLEIIRNIAVVLYWLGIAMFNVRKIRFLPCLKHERLFCLFILNSKHNSWGDISCVNVKYKWIQIQKSGSSGNTTEIGFCLICIENMLIHANTQENEHPMRIISCAAVLKLSQAVRADSFKINFCLVILKCGMITLCFTWIHLQKVVTINKLGLRFLKQVGFEGTSVLCYIPVYFFFSSLVEVPAWQSYFADVILGMKNCSVTWIN